MMRMRMRMRMRMMMMMVMMDDDDDEDDDEDEDDEDDGGGGDDDGDDRFVCALQLVFRGIHGAFYFELDEDDEGIRHQPGKMMTCMELYHQEGRCAVARAIITYSDDHGRGGSGEFAFL